MLFYYLTRMIVSPHFAQILWRRDIAPSLSKEKRAFTLSWLAALSVLLLLMCTPYENDFIAGYLVPVFFIIFTLGVGKLRYPFLNLLGCFNALPAELQPELFARGTNRIFAGIYSRGADFL